ncbi:hypothetical protein BKI52_29255 [marine bacterium AO1-C]|nr:hypothetical protein BKI52_29255 [marine bacterium AO1-C]
MKKIYFFILLLAGFACSQPKDQSQTKEDSGQTKQSPQLVVDSTLKELVKTAPVKGAILIYDYQQKRYYSNDFDWAKRGQLPASTFKIPNSLIALEVGTVKDDSTLLKWDGKKRYLKIWEKDMIFRQGFHLSCLPCYQELSRKAGEEQMQAWVDKLKYGKMVFDSTSYDRFWVVGDSRITPFEQIDFLIRFHEKKLPISARTDKIAKRMMVRKQTDQYVLRAKTGLSNPEGKLNGWFVGYVEKGDKLYFFASNFDPKPGTPDKEFLPLRIELTMKALKQKGIL